MNKRNACQHTHKAVKFSFCFNQVNLCKGAISRDKGGQLVAWTHFDEKYKQESGDKREYFKISEIGKWKRIHIAQQY